MSISVFIIIATGTLAIALVTVIFQAIKASMINPASALKIE